MSSDKMPEMTRFPVGCGGISVCPAWVDGVTASPSGSQTQVGREAWGHGAGTAYPDPQLALHWHAGPKKGVFLPMPSPVCLPLQGGSSGSSTPWFIPGHPLGTSGSASPFFKPTPMASPYKPSSLNQPVPLRAFVPTCTYVLRENQNQVLLSPWTTLSAKVY